MPSDPLVSVPLPLRHAIEIGECVLFLGAGVGEHLSRPDGTTLPDSVELAEEMKKQFSLSADTEDLSKVAELIQIRGKREELDQFLRKRLSDVTPDDTFRWITSRRWRAIFTTNYDKGIERAYDLAANPSQQAVSVSRPSEVVPIDPRFEVPIYHIHGAAFGESQRLIVSQSDYATFREPRKMLFELLKREFVGSTFLYVGYSNRDPNWLLVLTEITEEFLPSTLPPSFRVSRSTIPEDIEILKHRGVNTLAIDFKGFVTAASNQLEPFDLEASRLQELKATIPPKFLGAFHLNPAPVLRLTRSWEFVNQAPFSVAPNTSAFYRGDRPNWAVIGSSISFRRDLEDEIYEEALDYVTSSAEKPVSVMVLGPAGYGMTTLLMNTAAQLVHKRAAAVFMLRPQAELLEGDVEFATTLIDRSEVPCFIVDDAADVAESIQYAIARLRDLNRKALFILGARTNEWHQRRPRIFGKEYSVESLSDPEIDRLLEALEKNHELNKLEPLSAEHRRVVIKEKHGKELLVTLREATEDKRFDAILEDEYLGIASARCQEIYLAVCCFHQHGVYLRDSLLCDIVGVPQADLHSTIKGHLDGVVIEESIDDAKGIFASRARHRAIADIVWDRCGDAVDKDQLLYSALEHLNLNYLADANAFEKLIRNEQLIDKMRGFEAKVRFFDLACKKDPDSPYVRQHYARMLYREKMFDLALAQVDQGIKIDPRNPPRVLYHTKATILAKLALEAENIDIGRRRLIQAEEAFRKAMALNAKDDYTYQALASMYLDWARQSQSDKEAAGYLSKAEETIADGLRKCRTKDALWMVSADIARFLGDRPSQLKALETAVRESPGSVVARYLLGKTYSGLGRFAEAMKTLEPNITSHPQEFRSFIEYALAMISSGKTLKEAIAVLEIASIAGLGDARYIAHLAGFYFLDGDFAKANEVWAEGERRELPQEDLQKASYRPRLGSPPAAFRLSGHLAKKRPTYSILEAEGYPSFVCPASKYGGLVLKLTARYTFEVVFSGRSAMALSPKPEGTT